MNISYRFTKNGENLILDENIEGLRFQCGFSELHKDKGLASGTLYKTFIIQADNLYKNPTSKVKFEELGAFFADATSGPVDILIEIKTENDSDYYEIFSTNELVHKIIKTTSRDESILSIFELYSK